MAQFPSPTNANGIWTLKKVKRNVQGSNWPIFPGAPTIGVATAASTQATVTFTAPTYTGSSAITSYTVTSSPGGITASGASSPITVTGLTNGTAYTFTVRATNSAGTGPSSAASNSVTPSAPTRAFTISPAVSGKTTWDLDTDGPLALSSYGDWTIVPLTNFSASVKIWGAGGGRGATNAFSTANAFGGGGGYAGGTFSATSGTTFVLRVGQGGLFTTTSIFESGTAFGGGGSGTNYSDRQWNCGGGGGLSGIFVNSVTQANSVLIAGGGGGGGGYFGGGSGIYQSDDQVSGGGGGSGRVNATYISSGTLTAGSGTTPGNSGDANRSGAGTGSSTAATAGSNGRIYIS